MADKNSGKTNQIEHVLIANMYAMANILYECTQFLGIATCVSNA
jgi:hypothetical protein